MQNPVQTLAARVTVSSRTITSSGPLLTEVFTIGEITYTAKLNQRSGDFSLTGSNGEHIRLTSADLHLQRNPVRASQNMRITPRNRITGCHVATGALGLAHSALWGLALGGPAGLGAGTAVGAFWWAVGTQC